MVQTLEQYVAQATNAYKPAQQALDRQLAGLDSQLTTANQQIDRNFAQQQRQLDTSSYRASQEASKQAASSGGTFGGAANIANRRYYDQSFVPAQTQLQVNKTNALADARQNYDTQLQNLQSQKQMLDAQANQQALQQYWSAQEAEKQRQSQNAYYKFLMDQYNAEKEARGRNYYLDSNLNQWGGYNWYDGNGNLHRVGTVANSYANGGDFTNSLKTMLEKAAGQGDAWSKEILAEIDRGNRFAYNPNGDTGNNIYDSMGIRLIGTTQPQQQVQPTPTITNNKQPSNLADLIGFVINNSFGGGGR